MDDTTQLPPRDVFKCNYVKNWNAPPVGRTSTNSTRHTTCWLPQHSLGRPGKQSGASALEMAQIGYPKAGYHSANALDIENVDSGEPLNKAVGRMLAEASSTTEKAEPFAAHSYRALSDVIGMVLLVMMGVSVFICLARFDFNFVLYLLGYHIVFHDATYFRMALSAPEGSAPQHSVQSVVVWVASKKMLRSVEWFSAFLAATLVLDFSWIYLAGTVTNGGWPSGASAAYMNGAPASSPSGETPIFLAIEETDQTLWPMLFQRLFYRLAVAGSVFNSFAKILVIVLTVLWSLRQRQNHKKAAQCGSLAAP